MRMDSPALLHLFDFIAVIDCGSLSAGARSRGRAQAAVTYSIQSLERDLGVSLFDRSTRPLAPTDQGRALAEVARDIIADVGRLQLRAAGLRAGVESRVRLVIDALTPMGALIPLATAFAREFPAIDLEVAVDTMSTPLNAVLEGSAVLGVVGPMALKYRDISAVPLVKIVRIAVAAPSHPLAGEALLISADVARQHRRIIMLNRSQAAAHPASDPLPGQVWRTSDIGAKREMLLAGLGWGNMPHHVVQDDVNSGRLVELQFAPDVASRWSEPLQFYLIRCNKHSSGVAATWIFNWMSGGNALEADVDTRVWREVS